MLSPYTDDAPERSVIDATPGPLLVEFGSNGCGYCQAAGPVIAEALATETLPHLRIQDSKGRRLGRSFGVKLWPTLVMLLDGKEKARVVRPTSSGEIRLALQALHPDIPSSGSAS